MNRSLTQSSLALLCLLIGLNPIRVAAQGQVNGSSPTLPLVFEVNEGQAPKGYAFLARRDGVQALYSSDGLEILAPASGTLLSPGAPTARSHRRGKVIEVLE